MPLNLDATWANALDDVSDPAYDALDLRLADAALVAGAGSDALVHGGITPHSTTSLAVSVDVADVVTVQPGSAVIPCDAIAAGGVYRAGINAPFTEALTARSATNPRIDLVVLRMLDTDVVGAHPQRRARLEIIAGVPSGAPAVPAKPSMAVELARITVPATGGGAATVNSAKRTFSAAAGGVLLVTTEAELPATAAPWQMARALDTGEVYDWNGAAWVAYGDRWKGISEAFVGAAPPNGTRRILKTGLSGGGGIGAVDGTYTFDYYPGAFPNGVVSVVVSVVEPGTGALAQLVADRDICTLAGWFGNGYKKDGTLVPWASINSIICYTAWGW